jgi:hypothetical protein
LPVLYGPCAREKKHMELSSASAGLSGRPARDVSRLAPHEPRWTYQAFLLGEAPLSTAGGSLTPDAPYLGYERPRPGDPICGTRRMRAGHHAAWAAMTGLRSPPWPPFPIRTLHACRTHPSWKGTK